MADAKRYYWLKLKEDFFEDDTIQWIEEQENGKEYALFYLKLCLKSLHMDGKVVRVIGERLMPYDKKSLAKVTNTDVDTVVIALQLFKRIGLIDIYDSGEIYMKQIEEMTGTETEAALRKRRYRAKLEANSQQLLEQPQDHEQWDNVPNMSHESPIELEKETREKSTEKKPFHQQADGDEIEIIGKRESAENEAIRLIFQHYLSKEIINHQKMTDPMKRAVRARLKDYSFDQLIQAIDNYAAVLKSDAHFFNYRYSLADLMRDKDVRKFIDDAEPLKNFAKEKTGGREQVADNFVQRGRQPFQMNIPVRRDERG